MSTCGSFYRLPVLGEIIGGTAGLEVHLDNAACNEFHEFCRMSLHVKPLPSQILLGLLLAVNKIKPEMN